VRTVGSPLILDAPFASAGSGMIQPQPESREAVRKTAYEDAGDSLQTSTPISAIRQGMHEIYVVCAKLSMRRAVDSVAGRTQLTPAMILRSLTSCARSASVRLPSADCG